MSESHGYLCIFDVRAGREDSNSDANVKDLESTFKSLGAEVIIKTNPHFDDVKNTLRELSEKDFTNYTYVAVAYFALGEVGLLKTADQDQMIKVNEDIMEPLLDGNPTLDQKLLWLIISDGRVYSRFHFDGPPKPRKQFFLKLYASIEQSSSSSGHRNRPGFISTLCRLLRGQYKKKDLINIVEEAAAEVQGENEEAQGCSQKPCVDKNFSAKFFLDVGFKSE